MATELRVEMPVAPGLCLAGIAAAAQVSRVENGNRPPTESFAKACDRVWPERNGWFLDYYTESREWLATPPWFRPWIPIEAATTDLRVWQNDVVPGLLQTEDYARAVLSVAPGVTPGLRRDGVRWHGVRGRGDCPGAGATL
jgi:hypothetical protein